MVNHCDFKLAIEIFEAGFNAGRRYEVGYCELRHPEFFLNKPKNGFGYVSTDYSSIFQDFLKSPYADLIHQQSSEEK